MINFKSTPFFKILFPFVVGIACVFLFGTFSNTHLVSLISFIVLLLAFLFQKYYKPTFYFKKGFYIFSINAFLFILAFESCFLYNARNDPEHYTHYVAQKEQCFMGVIDDLPVRTEKATKLFLRIQSVSRNNQWHYATGNIIVYLKNNSGKRPEVGDDVFVSTQLSVVNEPKNPYEFNYKSFLEDRNIFHTAYVQRDKFNIIEGFDANFSVLQWGTQIKSRVVNVLRRSGLSQEAFAICAALLVGYDDEIDNDIMQSFSHSGTLHILSVSGMHTGVLYGVLIFIFSLFDKYDRHKKLKCFFIILSLAFFVGITGFSPSVLRAALMLGLVILGKTFYKQGNSYNTLLLSAFLLLLYNPYLIKDIGFLLSYLAVFGIMYFYPILNKLYVFQNRILQWLWASVLISASATLFTLPVSFYYFHQFPIWFAFSNLIIIPISMFIMLGGVLLLFLSKILILNQCLVFLINGSTSIMLYVAKFTDNPTYGFIDFISFSKFDLLCCTLTLIIFLLILATKKHKHVMVLCLICIIWLSNSVYAHYTDLHQRELMVFHIKNKSVFALRNGHNVYGNFQTLTEKEFQRSVKPYLLQIPGLILTKTEANIFKNTATTILNITRPTQDLAPLTPDYIIVSNDADLHLLMDYKNKPVVIADCSNSNKFLKKLKKQCLRLGITLYNIKEQGALQLKI